MRKWCFATVVGMGLAAVLMVLATPRPAHAFIHEIIAALCRAPDGDVEPPGQLPGSKAFVRALMATGFIVSIETVGNVTTVTFDPTVPNSKFMSTGADRTIPMPDGTFLVLHPEVVADPDFPAHAHCTNY